MLAVVDDFASAGKFVRRGAAAKIGTPLEEFNVVTGIGQRAAGGDAGQSSANDGHSWRARVVAGEGHCKRRRNPFASTLSFSAVLKRTRSENTS